MKKVIPKNIVIVMAILLVGVSAIVGVKNISKGKEEKENNIKFAIMITNDSGDGYKEFRENITWPDINYKINLEKSECLDIDGNKKEDVITFDHTNWEAVVETDETVYCTLYFDKANPSIGVDSINPGYTNLNLKATPHDIEGTIEKYEFKIGKDMNQLSEWQEGTLNEDRTANMEYNDLEVGTEYYVKVKVTETIGGQEKEVEVGPYIFPTKDKEPEIVKIEKVSVTWKAATVRTTAIKGSKEIGSYCYVVKEGTIENDAGINWENAECTNSSSLSHTKELSGLDESTTYTIFVKAKDINGTMSLNYDKVEIKTETTPRPTVSFNGNGGSSCASKQVKVDDPYGTLCTPTRTGYTFSGWYTSSSGGSRITSSTIVTNTNNHTLYAHWTANSYTVSYDSNGGSSCSSKSVTFNSSYGTLCSPSRSCYTFDGWYLNGRRITSSSTVSTASSHSLKASWSLKNVTVSFDSAGGGYCSSQTASCNGSYYIPCTPTPPRSCNSFAGWYYGSSRISSGTSLKTNSNHTLTAHWNSSDYTVYYDNNGGSGCSSKSVSCGGTYGSLCSPNPPRSCNSFAGWYYNGSSVSSGSSLKSDSSHTITASWNANSYTVYYDNAGGSGCSTTTVTCGGTYSGLCTPSRSGYNFAGWYYGGTRVDNGTFSQSDGTHTLTAHWTEIPVDPPVNPPVETPTDKPIRITFNVNYGTLAQSSINNGYGLNSYNYIAYKGNTYERMVYPGDNVGSDGLPNYNTEGHINLTRSGKVVEPGKEWYKRNHTDKILNQTTAYTYNYLRNNYIIESEDETAKYYNLYLYVNWRNCSVWNKRTVSDGYYSCNCTCYALPGTYSGQSGNYSSCGNLCADKFGNNGLSKTPTGQCKWIAPTYENTTCKVYG